MNFKGRNWLILGLVKFRVKILVYNGEIFRKKIIKSFRSGYR